MPTKGSEQKDQPPIAWIEEGRLLADSFVYSADLRDQIQVIERGLLLNLSEWNPPENLIEAAKRIAVGRSSVAAALLALSLQD